MPKGGITGPHGTVSPAGIIHAVDLSTNKVACGTPLRELSLFERNGWDQSNSPLRCGACWDAVNAAKLTSKP